MSTEEQESNSCLSVSAHLDTKQFRRQTSNIQQLHMLTKKMHLPTVLPHNTACWLLFFPFSCPPSKEASIHIYFSTFWILLFTTRLVPAHLCQGSRWQAEKRRMSRRRSLLRCRGHAAEVDSQIRGESTGQEAAAVR